EPNALADHNGRSPDEYSRGQRACLRQTANIHQGDHVMRLMTRARVLLGVALLSVVLAVGSLLWWGRSRPAFRAGADPVPIPREQCKILVCARPSMSPGTTLEFFATPALDGIFIVEAVWPGYSPTWFYDLSTGQPTECLRLLHAHSSSV